MFQWQSARRTSGEEEGTWQEKVPSSVEEGIGDCISSAHSHLTPTLHTHHNTTHIFIALYSTYKRRAISEQQSHTQPVQLCAVGRCSSVSCGKDEEKQLLVGIEPTGANL